MKTLSVAVAATIAGSALAFGASSAQAAAVVHPSTTCAPGQTIHVSGSVPGATEIEVTVDVPEVNQEYNSGSYSVPISGEFDKRLKLPMYDPKNEVLTVATSGEDPALYKAYMEAVRAGTEAKQAGASEEELAKLAAAEGAAQKAWEASVSNASRSLITGGCATSVEVKPKLVVTPNLGMPLVEGQGSGPNAMPLLAGFGLAAGGLVGAFRFKKGRA